jgi:uncharacterized protein YcfL
MKKMTPFLILLLAAGGCVTHVTRVETAEPLAPPVAQRQTVTDKRVVIDPGLDQTIHIVGIKSTTGPEGFLKIQLDVQNQTDSARHFSYRIDWYNKDGLELPMAASAPLTWMLLGRETSFLAATAPTPTARDFRVTFLPN